MDPRDEANRTGTTGASLQLGSEGSARDGSASFACAANFVHFYIYLPMVQQKHLADVEDMDYFFGMPILAWAVVVTIIAFILYCAGMRLVSSLARRKAEDTDYFLQSPV